MFIYSPTPPHTRFRDFPSERRGQTAKAYRGRLIYVRYFAVRDAQKNYRGVIEMSQDITDIKTIEGERRLLEWE